VFNAIEEFRYWPLSREDAASTTPKCIDYRHVVCLIQKEDDYDLRMSAAHSSGEFKAPSRARVEIGSDDDKINLAGNDCAKKIRLENRRGIASAIANKSLCQKVTAHSVTVDDKHAERRLRTLILLGNALFATHFQ
jgi:hypothetical protein